jgi:hypothetical protein
MHPTRWPTSFVIRVYDSTGNVIETHEHTGEFKASQAFVRKLRFAISVER